MLGNHHYSLIPEYFIIPKGNPPSLKQSFPIPSAPEPCWPLIRFLSPWVGLFWTLHINEIIQSTTFGSGFSHIGNVLKIHPQCSMKQYSTHFLWPNGISCIYPTFRVPIRHVFRDPLGVLEWIPPNVPYLWELAKSTWELFLFLFEFIFYLFIF